MCSLQCVFSSTAMVFLLRRKGARALLIVRSCCVSFPRHREGVDVLQPKGWFVNLHDSAVVVVCAFVESVGFASIPLVIAFPGFRGWFWCTALLSSERVRNSVA